MKVGRPHGSHDSGEAEVKGHRSLGPKSHHTHASDRVTVKVVEVELGVSGTRKYPSSTAHTLVPAIPPGPGTPGPFPTLSLMHKLQRP
jgi:hypothetical protein